MSPAVLVGGGTGYMRRCAATVKCSSEPLLAQGIEFGTGGAGAGRMC